MSNYRVGHYFSGNICVTRADEQGRKFYLTSDVDKSPTPKIVSIATQNQEDIDLMVQDGLISRTPYSVFEFEGVTYGRWVLHNE